MWWLSKIHDANRSSIFFFINEIADQYDFNVKDVYCTETLYLPWCGPVGGIKSAAKWITMRLGLPKNGNCSVYHGEKFNFWPVEKTWQCQPGFRTKVREGMCRLVFPPKVLFCCVISQCISQLSWIRSQHPPTQLNLRGGR
jgi:hypothetical protein